MAHKPYRVMLVCECIVYLMVNCDLRLETGIIFSFVISG